MLEYKLVLYFIKFFIMISLIKYFKKSILLFDILGALLVNFFYPFFNRKKNNESKYILAYAPFKNKP